MNTYVYSAVQQERTCPVCGTTKEVNSNNFYQSKFTEDGYAVNCRACCVAKTIANERIREAKIKAERDRPVTYSEVMQKRKERSLKRYERVKAIQAALKQGHKECGCCGKTKSLFDFNVDKSKSTGYSSWCKSCKKEASNG
jgi:hypothetical protein